LKWIVFKMRVLEVVLLREMLVGFVRERWLCLFGGVDAGCMGAGG
jgi:hypothetical protein